jgi:hypothetical protein
VLVRNGTVLALHALACVAGFIAVWAPPGPRSRLQNVAGPSAIVFVTAATIFSLLELFAVFLPLAAWSLASRRGAWDELLAATIATTAIAAPLLLVAGAVEIWFTPRLLIALAG